jgi:hypothetical protein
MRRNPENEGGAILHSRDRGCHSLFLLKYAESKGFFLSEKRRMGKMTGLLK